MAMGVNLRGPMQNIFDKRVHPSINDWITVWVIAALCSSYSLVYPAKIMLYPSPSLFPMTHPILFKEFPLFREYSTEKLQKITLSY